MKTNQYIHNNINTLSLIKLCLSFLVILILAYFSGWREVGVDRGNYITLVNLIRSTDDLNEKILFAKDITFLLVSNLAILFSPDVKIVFLILCLISLIAKYFAIKKISPNYLFKYIILYAIFLSTGLEFAAMRSGLSIGFLLLAISFKENKWLFIIFSIMTITSHISMLPVIFLTIPKINDVLSKNKSGYFAITFITAIIGSSLISFSFQGANYENNNGTLFAYSEPIATLIIAFMVFYRTNNLISHNQLNPVVKFLLIARTLVFSLIAISFGIISTVVTASTRYLEISWCLLLLCSLITYKRSPLNLIGIFAFILFLSYINYRRLTWLGLINL